MAASRVPNNGDQLDYQGFLNDLQDWELSLKEKDEKLNAQSHEPKSVGSSTRRAGIIGRERISSRNTSSFDISQSNAQHFDHSRSLKDINSLSSSLTEESSPNAGSEKDLGNEYFKKKRFNEAIDCYSRSIALSPTAVAFANRAMAYLKIKRFEEAENDCTEAIDLDDRYVKAYSRRATARKELGKLKSSIQDSEFALRLEPQNQELKQQYAEAKVMYDKELFEKASRVMKRSTQEAQKVRADQNLIMEVKSNVTKSKQDCQEGATISSGAEAPEELLEKASRVMKVSTQGAQKVRVDQNLIRDVKSNITRSKRDFQEGATISSCGEAPEIVHGVNKRELRASMQDRVLHAASQEIAQSEKNITPPKSAYQFEIFWKGLSGDHARQARLLKVISPFTLTQLFQSSLSSTLLIDIIKCISTFFKDETELAVEFLRSLTKVPRFEMIIMCLFGRDKFDLQRMWEDVFLSTDVPVEYAETLSELYPKYCLRGKCVCSRIQMA